MATQDILLLLSLGIIVLWTTRLARSKGLNPWFWGVGAVLLIAVAWNFSRQFLGPVVMAPLIFLLLFRSPLFRRNRGEASTTTSSMPCPKCGAPETGGLNFCVQCGWELARSAAEATEGEPEVGGTETAGMAEPGTTEPAIEAPAAETGQGPDWAPPAGAEAAVAQAEEAMEEVAEAGPAEGEAEPGPGSAPAPAPEPTREPVLAQEATASPVEPAAPTPQTSTEATPVPETTSEPIPEPARAAPTPANLTERGVSLFNQGRFQEAIDQFTKAIALDPNYREAWARRAEAYGRLGRPERQQADQRRLEAI